MKEWIVTDTVLIRIACVVTLCGLIALTILSLSDEQTDTTLIMGVVSEVRARNDSTIFTIEKQHTYTIIVDEKVDVHPRDRVAISGTMSGCSTIFAEKIVSGKR